MAGDNTSAYCRVCKEGVAVRVTSDAKRCNFQIIGDEKPLCAPYQWINGTNFVLANHKNMSVRDIVIHGWNDTYLQLSMCVEKINRKRNCHREDHEQVVRCHVDCSRFSKVLQSNGITPGIPIAVPLLSLVVLRLVG